MVFGVVGYLELLGLGVPFCDFVFVVGLPVLSALVLPD